MKPFRRTPEQRQAMFVERWPPVVRPQNPLTSFEGEARVNKGSRETHMARIREAIELRPGQIRAEIAKMLGLSEYETSKRLSDLKNLEAIQPGAPRKAPGGRNQQTWWPATTASVDGQSETDSGESTPESITACTQTNQGE